MARQANNVPGDCPFMARKEGAESRLCARVVLGREGAVMTNTHRFLLFVTMCALAGFGGAVGSMLGHSFGSTGLYVGGIGGGLVAVTLGAWVAVSQRWIPRTRLGTTALGASVGFLAAVAVAVNTLSSPVGPVLSTLLVGIGALLGSRGARSDAGRDSPPNP
jgi:hypothetical protein